MSLIVWLPLNGNLNNQGISGATVTNDGATVNTSGKIGSCYEFSAGIMTLPAATVTNFQECSISLWLKINSWNSNWDTYFQLGLGSTAWTQYTFGLLRNNGSTLCFCTSNGSSATQTNCKTGTLNLNEWYHITCVYKAGHNLIYVNGALVQDYSNSIVPNFAGITSIKIGAITKNGTYQTKCCMNDFRIYNHALSAAEIKEIAQGLVLHYKLDGGLFGNPNLYTGSKDFSGSWVNKNNWTTDSETYNGFVVKKKSTTWGGLAQNIPCTQNDIFTISFYAKVDSGGQIMSIHRSNLGNVTTGLSILTGNFYSGVNWITTAQDGTQWQRYWATIQITGADVTYLQWRIENNQSEKNLYICGMKLEKGSSPTGWSPAASEDDYSTIYDNSGYGHNGILNDTNAQFITATRRYSACIKNSQATNSATYLMRGECNIPESNALTFSWWMNPTSLGHQTSGIFSTSNGTATDYQTTAANMRDSCFDCCNTSGTCVRINVENYITLNEWHHYALTYNGSQLNFYKDGESKVTANQTGALKAFQYIYPFYSKAGGANRCTSGSLSDFRIYVTQLLDNDIKSLYNTSMKVDNKYNVHSFEIIETNTNKITKQGQAKFPTMYENGIIEKLHYDKTIYTEPDGSTWVRVFHHNDPTTSGLFVKASDWEHGVYGSADKWYDMEQIIPLLVKYEFMVKQKTTSSAGEAKYRWIQTADPLTCVYNDVSPGKVTINTSSGYSSSSMGGLWKMNGNARMCIANTSAGNWYGAMGSWTTYNTNNVPGYPNNNISTGYLDFYVRVYPNIKDIKNYGLTADQFIER